jgi:hypothetical protein
VSNFQWESALNFSEGFLNLKDGNRLKLTDYEGLAGGPGFEPCTVSYDFNYLDHKNMGAGWVQKYLLHFV